MQSLAKEILIILPIILIAGCVGQSAETDGTEQGIYQTVSFSTDDGWMIFADYYPADGEPVILVHMLGRTRSDWKQFAEALNREGFAVLAIDMRGHGQSLQSAEGQRTFASFDTQDWLSAANDIQAASNFLAGKDHDTGRIGIVGASIGANLALRYSADNDHVQKLALLSPGLDYRGVETADVIPLYSNSIILVASLNDPQSESAVRVLYDAAVAEKQIKLYESAGHGTDMLSGTDLQPLLIEWLKENLQ